MTSPGSGPTPEKRALLEAYEAVVGTETARKASPEQTPPPRRRGSPIIAIGLASIALIAGYGAFLRPAWLVPSAVVAESPRVREASLRIALFLQARRIQQFRAERGRLPHDLVEVGSAVANGIRYRAVDSTAFALDGVSGPLSLTLHSADSLPSFLGNSFAVISQRAGK